MIEPGAITVRCRWQDGAFLLWGEVGQRVVLDEHELKTYLFGWHRPSFYGTFIETQEREYKAVAVLPAAMALDYFCDPAVLKHARLRFAEEMERLMRLAPAVREALESGSFMPDFRKWRAGRPGVKLALAEPEASEADAIPSFAPWVDALIAERARSDEATARKLKTLAQAYPNLPFGRFSGEWMDEEDWLAAIGWTVDPTPFRTCLQLVEPTDREGWRLRILLQDRDNKERMAEWRGENGVSGDVPASWGEHLARVRKDIRRWTAIVPWLGESQEDDRAHGGETLAAEPAAARAAAGSPAQEMPLPSPPGPGTHAHNPPDSPKRPGDAGAADRTVSAQRPDPPFGLRTRLGEDEAWLFLTDASLRLAEAGETVFLPAWWERARQMKPRLKMRIHPSVGAPGQPVYGLRQMFQFDWRLAIGDLELSEQQFRELLEQKRRLMRFRGQWIELDPDTLEQIRRKIKRVQKGLSFRDVLELHLLGPDGADRTAGEEPDRGRDVGLEVELNEPLREMILSLTQTSAPPAVPDPASFAGTLRAYQREGVSWMLYLRRFGLGGCLADDMGLGKTIQWITYLLSVKEREAPENPSLIVCPTSVLGNWQKELQRFAPTLKVHLHYGPKRYRGEQFRTAARQCDLVLTSYTLAHLDASELRSVEWDSICLDEAQNIKNAFTKQAASVRSLRGGHRIAMTGTPLENRLAELWSIFDFINPGYLGSLRDFHRRFAHAIEKENDAGKIAQLKRLVGPFLKRREKRDPAIQLELPEKHEAKVFVSLTAEQGALYENCIRDMFEKLERATKMERRGIILAVLTKLKQLCDHPALFMNEGAAAQTIERSHKVRRLVEMAGELRAEGDRCLIFTQFVEAGHMLKRILEKELRERVQFLHGGTPKAERDEMVARFQNADIPDDEACGIFILSLKAGGIGLNLTAANHVFHFDRWWNPAVENQATDRAYRIGQQRRVQVHKFVTLGTLEEKIDEMIERKMSLTEQIIGGGESWLTELSTDELRELFALRSNWEM